MSIVKTEGTVGGRARIDGSRIAVWHIAALANQGVKPEQIAGDEYYPHITREQVEAALAYYRANKAEIDKDISDNTQD